MSIPEDERAENERLWNQTPAELHERFTHNAWLLVVTFPPLDVQWWTDPESVFPNDDASKLVREVVQRWITHPYDVCDYVRWCTTRVEISGEVLEQLTGFVEWLGMHTIPNTVVITQERSETEADETWSRWLREAEGGDFTATLPQLYPGGIPKQFADWDDDDGVDDGNNGVDNGDDNAEVTG